MILKVIISLGQPLILPQTLFINELIISFLSTITNNIMYDTSRKSRQTYVLYGVSFYKTTDMYFFKYLYL